MSDEGVSVPGGPAPSLYALSALPPRADETLTQMGIAQMIYAHGMQIYNGSYEKSDNKFRMSMEDALFVATAFFAKGFSHAEIVSRFEGVCDRMKVPNSYRALEGSRLLIDGDPSDPVVFT